MSTYIFDLDGTISIDGQIVDEVIGKKIQKLLNHNEVVFASARPIRDILSLLPASLHRCLMVGCNGAMAYKNGQLYFLTLLTT